MRLYQIVPLNGEIPDLADCFFRAEDPADAFEKLNKLADWGQLQNCDMFTLEELKTQIIIIDITGDSIETVSCYIYYPGDSKWMIEKSYNIHE